MPPHSAHDRDLHALEVEASGIDAMPWIPPEAILVYQQTDALRVTVTSSDQLATYCETRTRTAAARHLRFTWVASSEAFPSKPFLRDHRVVRR